MEAAGRSKIFQVKSNHVYVRLSYMGKRLETRRRKKKRKKRGSMVPPPTSAALLMLLMLIL